MRPNENGFEIVAGARRFRAAQPAELFSLPARIGDIDDSEKILWQLVENSQRVDVHPYEEAQGLQRLLDMPGYAVAALVEKSGKSAAHVYARLSLLRLIPEVAEAFTQERIIASHANLIARSRRSRKVKHSSSAGVKIGRTTKPTCYPPSFSRLGYRATFISPWPMRRSTAKTPLNPAAGACVTCPCRSGHKTSLFCDVQGDQCKLCGIRATASVFRCLDSACYHGKVEAFLDREIAAHPDSS